MRVPPKLIVHNEAGLPARFAMYLVGQAIDHAVACGIRPSHARRSRPIALNGYLFTFRANRGVQGGADSWCVYVERMP